jgi:outer membrane protein OmpA-like peptidoglycan-associated protein
MKQILAFIFLFASSLISLGQSTDVYKVNDHKTILSVYFEVSNFQINDAQRAEIVKIVTQLNVKDITIKGYADSTGNLQFNNNLALDRVGTIENFITLKFPSRVLHTSSVGEDPLAKKHSLRKQRRVDIELTTSQEVIEHMKKQKSLPLHPKEQIKETELKPPTPIKKTPEQEFSELMNSGDKVVFENVLFQPGKSDFQYNKTPNELYYLAEMMDTIPSMRIEVAGHVCCEDDQKLSESRAKTVYLFLRGYGIEKSRITYVGHSNKDPRVEELTPADERINRRVEVIVVER